MLLLHGSFWKDFSSAKIRSSLHSVKDLIGIS